MSEKVKQFSYLIFNTKTFTYLNEKYKIEENM